jgi:hypothetical protein
MEMKARSLWAPWSRFESVLEPRVLVTAMVRHNVDDDLDPCAFESGHHFVELSQGADVWVYIPIVRDIV